jgi:hypothetical protein
MPARVRLRPNQRDVSTANLLSDRIARLLHSVGQRRKPTPDVPRAKPRAPLDTTENVGGGGSGSASAASACEQVREVTFRIAAGSAPAEGDAVRVRNGNALALEANGRVVGTFTDSTVSGCLALGYAFAGEITAVRGAAGTASIRGSS